MGFEQDKVTFVYFALDSAQQPKHTYNLFALVSLKKTMKYTTKNGNDHLHFFI